MFEKIKSVVRDLWRPRTEVGRQIKHKILYGGRAPAERQGRRYLRRR